MNTHSTSEPSSGDSPGAVEHVQTRSQIQAILSEAGLKPRHALGQNFLIDGNLMRKLVASAEIDSRDLILEVGGGTGALTELLARHAGEVVTVEKDAALAEVLRQRVGSLPNVEVIEGDALRRKHELDPRVVEFLRGGATFSQIEGGDAFRQAEGGQGSSDIEGGNRTGENPGGERSCPIKLVANLPYQIATPLVMNLLLRHRNVRRLCFTVQAEVGERIVAGPGSKAYGPLSIVTQTTARVETIARLSPKAFWPAPEVHSVMLRLDVHEPDIIAASDLVEFSNLVRATFHHRRKKLRSALRTPLDDEQIARAARIIDLDLRPEQISPPDWARVFADAFRGEV